MAAFKGHARLHVEHDGLVRVERGTQRLCAPARGVRPMTQHPPRLGAALHGRQRGRLIQIDLDRAQLRQPGAGGQRAHAVPIRQHDACAAGRQVLVGRLHQLPARRPAPAFQMPGLVFLAGAHVELVERTRRLLRLERRERRRVDIPDAGALRHVAGLFARSGQRGFARLRQGRLAAIGQFPARQQPFHRAVAQGGDTVRNAGVDQRLRADDAAGAAGAVDHHKGLGIRRQLADAVDQFRPRQAVRERQREVVEFLRLPRRRSRACASHVR
ncbi:hypothetical protein G6F57_017719 [Rhizopus arrhizus]|nr:hypothetical protein G6F57_017719 [Rhizopus arrhizus]